MNRLERGLTAAVIGFPVAVIASKLGRIYLEQAWFAVLPLLAAAVLGVLGFEYMRRKARCTTRSCWRLQLSQSR